MANMLRSRVARGAGHGPTVRSALRPIDNASYLAAASLVAKAFSFLLMLYANRVLGPRLLGNYGIVLSFVGLFGVATDLGLSTLVVRDVTADRTLAVRYISNVVVLRVVISIAAIVVIVLLSQFVVSPALRGAVFVYALALVPLAITSTLQLVYQFAEQLQYSAILNVITSALTAALSALVLFNGHHVLGLVAVFSIVTLIGALTMAWILYTRFLPLRLELDLRWWPLLIRSAVPFATMTVLNVVYNYADRQILQVISHCNTAVSNIGCVPVGEYSAAYRPLDVLVAIFVGNINAATLPAFARVATESRLASVRLLRSAITLVAVCSVPMAVLGTFFASEVLHVIAGRQFLDATPALAILVWTFPCVLIVGMLYASLYAHGQQRVVAIAFAITLVVNVVGNILLIPHFSYMASAVLTVVSELLNGVIVYPTVRRTLGPLGLIVPLGKVAAIAAVAAGVLWLLHPFGILVGLPLGILVILACIRLTRVLGPTERDALGRLPFFGRFVPLLA